MLRHLLKLIWQRKSRNLLLSLEILLAFVLVFAVAAFAARCVQLQQLPTGFSYRNQWMVQIRTAKPLVNDVAVYDQLQRNLLALPEVEQVAFAALPVYEMSRRTGTFDRADGTGPIRLDVQDASDQYGATMDMRVTSGRWFSSADDGADTTPVVIDQLAAERLFPGAAGAPVGQLFSDPSDETNPTRYRVVGVVEAFRSHGEYMAPVPFILPRFRPGVGKEAVTTIMLKLRPGTPRLFESTLSARIKQSQPDWSLVITPLAEARASMLGLQLVPLKICAVIAAFLLVMVAFGLFGVLWQNTTQRIPEIGLRRALGAASGSIYRQIIAEQLMLSSGAIMVGMLLLIQLPLTGALGAALNWTVFWAALALSAGVIYLLSLLCSLYPGWRAAQLSPTQALHYE
jgi:putative ABC transport system permease protein